MGLLRLGAGWWWMLGWWRMVVGGRMGDGWGMVWGEGGESSLWWGGSDGEVWGTGEMVWGLTLAIPLRLGLLAEVRGVVVW